MINNFRSSLADAGNLRSLYEHCVGVLRLPGDYSDLLRMSLIYCLSALDKLIHDIIVHEMVEIYMGRRAQTPKYRAESLTLENHEFLSNGGVPPVEIIFENIIRLKLSHLSFMDPEKLSDGLSLVWLEKHKWQVIAGEMGRNEKDVKTELRNLFKRRNAIVHEGDREPGASDKLLIDPSDADRAREFIANLGEAIYVSV